MKKITKSVRYALIAAATLVAAGAFTAASKPDFALGRNIQILFNMFRDVSAFYVDSVDTDEMLRDAAAGMTSNLDPYTVLIPEDEMEEFEILTTGKYGGIGALVRQSGDWIAIAQPYEGFPADKAGLVIGDKLLEVDGRSIRGLDVSEVSSMLKGSPGTALRLKVEKLLTGEQADVTLRRERIKISGIPYYGMIADGVGYILHDDFTEECSLDMRRALVELKKQGATSLIIDLRGNGGGILQEAVKILSLLVPKGTEVVSMKGRIGELDETFTTQADPIDTRMPVVVLVNSQSASAAEIVSGALQDLDRAVLLGQRTFGKGLVQSTRPLGYNAFLKVTTAKYYIPSGRCIQALDYAHRNDDGSVGTVPDSLIREFRTSGGRKVYDGGGVMPDVRIEPQFFTARGIWRISRTTISGATAKEWTSTGSRCRTTSTTGSSSSCRTRTSRSSRRRSGRSTSCAAKPNAKSIWTVSPASSKRSSANSRTTRTPICRHSGRISASCSRAKSSCATTIMPAWHATRLCATGRCGPP